MIYIVFICLQLNMHKIMPIQRNPNLDSVYFAEVPFKSASPKPYIPKIKNDWVYIYIYIYISRERERYRYRYRYRHI